MGRWVALLLLGCLPLLLAADILGAPYGDSHDGRNGSTWARAAEALRTDPLDSRLGAVREDGSVYAHHPPGIIGFVAIARTAGGSTPTTDRVAVGMATGLGAVLLFVLLRDVGYASVPSAVGAFAVAASPMVEVYGTMVDTPILAFPAAVAVLLAVRRLDDVAPAPPWTWAAFAVGPLISWQLLVLNGLVAASLFARVDRRARVAQVVASTAAGATATVMWLLLAHGSFRPVYEIFLVRSGAGTNGAEADLAGAWAMQRFAAETLLGPLLVFVIVAIAIAARSGPAARTARLTIGTVALYALGLHHGAAFHDYWSYLVIIPVGLGTAEFVTAVQRRLQTDGSSTAAAAVAAALAGTLIGVGLLDTSPQERVHATGARAATVLESAEPPPDQDVLWLLAEFSATDGWAVAASPLPLAHLTADDLRRELLAGHDDHLVVASTSCPPAVLVCGQLPIEHTSFLDRRFEVLPLHALASDSV